MVMNLNDWKSIRAEYEFKTGKPLDVYDDAGCLSCVEWAINVGLAEVTRQQKEEHLMNHLAGVMAGADWIGNE